MGRRQLTNAIRPQASRSTENITQPWPAKRILVLLINIIKKMMFLIKILRKIIPYLARQSVCTFGAIKNFSGACGPPSPLLPHAAAQLRRAAAVHTRGN